MNCNREYPVFQYLVPSTGWTIPEIRSAYPW